MPAASSSVGASDRLLPGESRRVPARRNGSGSYCGLCNPLITLAELAGLTDTKPRLLRVQIDIWPIHAVNFGERTPRHTDKGHRYDRREREDPGLGAPATSRCGSGRNTAWPDRSCRRSPDRGSVLAARSARGIPAGPIRFDGPQYQGSVPERWRRLARGVPARRVAGSR